MVRKRASKGAASNNWSSACMGKSSLSRPL
jgi:hypothetical protein